MRLTHSPDTDAERGSAPAEFVLVGTVLILLFLALIQLVLILHVKNTVTDAASEGAHYAALKDRNDDDGVRRTQELITRRLSPALAHDVFVRHESRSGVETVVIEVRAAMPLLGFWGVTHAMKVEGHAPL